MRKIEDFREASKRLFRYDETDTTLCMAYNCLSEKYREAFAMGFAMHFLLDEIGQETEYMWEMVLADKLFENAQYINNIYDMVDRTIFARYAITKTDSASTETETRKSDTVEGHSDKSVDSMESSGERNTGSSANNTYGESSSNKHSGESSDTSNTDANSTSATSSASKDTETLGTSEITTSGESRSEKSNDVTSRDNVSGSSSERVTQQHKEVNNDDKKTGSKAGSSEKLIESDTKPTDETGEGDVVEHEIDTSNTSGSSRETVGHKGNTNDTSFSATPQNGLANVKAGKYLTNFTAVEGQEDSKNTESQAGSDEGHTYDRTTTRRSLGEHNEGSEGNTYGESVEDVGHSEGWETLNTKDDATSTDTSNETEKVNVDRQSATASSSEKRNEGSNVKSGDSSSVSTDTSNTDASSHSTDTASDDYSKASSGNEERTETSNESSTSRTERSSDGTSTSTTTGDATRGNAGTQNVEHYEYTYDVLKMSEPLLRKVWELFDECFIGIA